QVRIGTANRPAPAYEQVGFSSDPVTRRASDVQKVQAADPIVIRVLLVRQIVGEQSVDKIDSVVTVSPYRRTLKGQAAAENITELKFSVAAFRSNAGNLLGHAECVSALDISFRQPRIQLPPEVHADTIFPLVGTDGCMAQCRIAAARNTGLEERRDHKLFPAQVVANVESEVLKTSVIASIIELNHRPRLAANQQMRLCAAVSALNKWQRQPYRQPVGQRIIHV